ncbi:MAG: PcfB family protein [Peptostreptococcaceae bacterium]|nr:PcfB family protein [Peptostreptococcaceae bacterium]
MINEEISNKTLSIAVQEGKSIGKAVWDEIKKIVDKAKKQGKSIERFIQDNSSEIKLKDLVKKGQLEEVPVKDAELKELRKQLHRYGVKFSVMKDKETGTHSVFFQAKDLKIMEHAFKKSLQTVQNKGKSKPSIIKQIKKYREMAKNMVSKDKVKNKEKEQSL